jgi:fumarate hydratase class II
MQHQETSRPNIKEDKDTSTKVTPLWGKNTELSLDNFPTGPKMPLEVIIALLQIKRACAKVNTQVGVLSSEMAERIVNAVDQIIEREMWEQFPLHVYQTGSGTQTNMNVNEVVANLAGLHPNDQVNASQSSNDTFSSAIHIATLVHYHRDLRPVIRATIEVLAQKSAEFKSTVKIGRTHLQDATPLTLGDEISAWEEAVRRQFERLEKAASELQFLAIGGTAVGTGINAPAGFGKRVASELTKIYRQKYTFLADLEFHSDANLFYQLSQKDILTNFHSNIKNLAVVLLKVGNDIRLLSSGPRAGIAELTIPSLDPGSSIMPGKVNPTQVEALTQVCATIMGHDATISFAASQGNFQLNVYMPVIAHHTVLSTVLLAGVLDSFNQKLLFGLEPNYARIRKNLDNSLMLVTALSPRLGYENAAQIARHAHQNGLTVFESASLLTDIPQNELGEMLDPNNMV